MAAKKSTWIAGTAVLGIVALGGTWLLGVSPLLDEASTIDDQTVAAQGENTVLEAKVARLKTASENLPALKAELAALQVGIPATEQVDAFLRTVDGYQTARALPVVKVEVTTPVSVTDTAGAAAAAAAPAATDTATTDASGTETPAPAETPAADGAATTDTTAAVPTSTVPDGFVAVPVTITAVGNFISSLGFLSDLQQAGGRLFLVTGVTGTGEPEAEASGGRPATQIGDVELQIKGVLYVLADQSAAAAVPEGDGTVPALPSLDPGKAAVGAGAGG
jgi:hypothetical protein